MTDMVGSALVRRHIGRRFESLRLRAGLTQDQVANKLDRGRGTISRMEDGDERVRFREIEVRAMLDLYEAEPQERELLFALTAETRNGKKKSWWHDYTETALPEWFGLYVSLEDSAETIRQYQSELISGLLQTREYAAELGRIESGYPEEESDLQRRVNVRMKRQALLTSPRAPRLDVILNEAVIRRPVGGPGVMAEQLTHVLDIAQKANVSIRIVPFNAGGHAGAGANAFTMLDFPKDRYGELLEPPLAYVDTLTGAMYLNKPNEIRAYQTVWDDLENKALSSTASKDMIMAALEGLKDG